MLKTTVKRCSYTKNPFAEPGVRALRCGAPVTHSLKGIGQFCAEHGKAMQGAALRRDGRKVRLLKVP